MFSWSLPFLAEKVGSMLVTIVKKVSGDDPEEEAAVTMKEALADDKQPIDSKKKKLLNIKSKI